MENATFRNCLIWAGAVASLAFTAAQCPAKADQWIHLPVHLVCTVKSGETVYVSVQNDGWHVGFL